MCVSSAAKRIVLLQYILYSHYEETRRQYIIMPYRMKIKEIVTVKIVLLFHDITN